MCICLYIISIPLREVLSMDRVPQKPRIRDRAATFAPTSTPKTVL